MSKSSRQAFYLYISSLAGIILGVAVSVLNTRSLSPVDYGDVRYVNNVIAFVASVLLLGYFVSGSRLLALSSTPKESKRINGAMIVILGITIVATILIMYFCYFIHLEWLNPKIASLFIYVMPVCAAPLLLNYINTSFQGDNKIAGISLARLLPSIVYIVAGYLVYHFWGATSVRMLLLQNGVAVIVLFLIIYFTHPSFENIKDSLKKLHIENKQYGLHVYVGSLAAVSLGYLGGITLGIFNDDNIQVGYYSLALTIATPLSMLPSIVGTTYYKKFAKQKKIDARVLVVTVLISIFSLAFFIIIINPVVVFLYKEEYMYVAKIASLLAIGTTVHGVGDMFNRFLGSHGKGKYLRNGALFCGIILVLGNIILVYFWGINGAVCTKILSATVYAISMIFYYLKYVKNGK